ncbi:hypothetical protein [Pandoraea anhela]|uniref:Uncharacterized protein n=1 Tax=Pandoraea anhela TaxID=2508295 RepID=A0A5E4W7I3_9BURK|nr:hypothetical protein [Pandoraea anhela]VVE20957.1 hypothetical protein PAN31108_03125 [Pandoraea anhela]
MTHASPTIRSAAELHQHLVANKHFDFRPDHGRDIALYRDLKRTLALPEGEFLTALRERSISAERYLRALIDAAEPLAAMYRDILGYCSRANFLRAKAGANVECEIQSAGQTIGFSFEDFRRFDKIKADLAPSQKHMRETKNEIMDWLAHEVFAPNHSALPRTDLDWRSVEMFRVLTQARDSYGLDCAEIFTGLGRYYLNASGDSPTIEWISRVIGHPKYPAKLAKVLDAFPIDPVELMASKFIELPFWKFRWQVYEVWIIAISLSEFEKLGFRLTANHDGHALIELGREATLATHSTSPAAFIYQPNYRNRSGSQIRPDILISGAHQATPDDGQLIIECKQRVDLDFEHAEDVADKYAAGVDAAVGNVIIVNYDDAPTLPDARSDDVSPAATLLGNVRPGTESERQFKQWLRKSDIARALRREAWFVDISLSMQSHLDDAFRERLSTHMTTMKPDAFFLYGFAQAVTPMSTSELVGSVEMSPCADAPNWEGWGIRRLRDVVAQHLHDTSLSLFIVSDIAGHIAKVWGNRIPGLDRVRFINPRLEPLQDVLER